MPLPVSEEEGRENTHSSVTITIITTVTITTLTVMAATSILFFTLILMDSVPTAMNENFMTIIEEQVQILPFLSWTQYSTSKAVTKEPAEPKLED